MSRVLPALAAVALLCAAGAASAQDFGGVRMSRQAALLDDVQQRDPGCPLSQTNVLVGVNRALSSGSLAQQRLGSASGGCRPLVSTQVVAGVNLATGTNSGADQTLSASSPKGLIATTNFTRGVNVAAGRNAAASQHILSQIDR